MDRAPSPSSNPFARFFQEKTVHFSVRGCMTLDLVRFFHENLPPVCFSFQPNDLFALVVFLGSFHLLFSPSPTYDVYLVDSR